MAPGGTKQKCFVPPSSLAKRVDLGPPARPPRWAKLGHQIAWDHAGLLSCVRDAESLARAVLRLLPLHV